MGGNRLCQREFWSEPLALGMCQCLGTISAVAMALLVRERYWAMRHPMDAHAGEKNHRRRLLLAIVWIVPLEIVLAAEDVREMIRTQFTLNANLMPIYVWLTVNTIFALVSIVYSFKLFALCHRYQRDQSRLSQSNPVDYTSMSRLVIGSALVSAAANLPILAKGVNAVLLLTIDQCTNADGKISHGQCVFTVCIL